MKRLYQSLLIFAFVSSAPLFAGEKVSAENPWLRAAPPVAKALAGYVTLSNDGKKDVKVTGARTDFAGKVELHRMTKKKGVMHMEEEPNPVIPAGGEMKMKPGGRHLMFMMLKRVPKAGETVKVELDFSDGSTMEIALPVRKKQP